MALKKHVFSMTKDVYTKMRSEINSLWMTLKHEPSYLLQVQSDIRRKLAKVNHTAIHIGGKAQQDAKRLEKDVNRFLHGELDRSQIDQVFIDALKLEQDTREL